MILASLARQLSVDGPAQSLLQPSIQLYKEKEVQGFASGSLSIKESCNLIVRLTERSSQTVLVIDALDECSPETRSDLLDALKAIIDASKKTVKIFISSRNDQDIVFHLTHHPNLEISSDRNSNDITRFVIKEAKRLIIAGKLLRHSTSRTEMEELIVREVIKGASGM
jgi:hypothetical protein